MTAMIVFVAFWMSLAQVSIVGNSQGEQKQPRSEEPLEKSSYLAFVDRDFVFTLEMIKPGIAIFNFISMVDDKYDLQAKQIRLTMGTRKVPGKLFMVDTGNPEEPVILPVMRMRPRSAFGFRLDGEFGEARELLGATVQLGKEDFNLIPLSSFDFENLSLKVNRINLGSPDFRDDWRVLKLGKLGTREPARRRSRLRPGR